MPTIPAAIMTIRPRAFHGSQSPGHIGWGSLVTPLTERGEGM